MVPMAIAIGANGCRNFRQWSIHWCHSLSPLAPMAPNDPFTELCDPFTQKHNSKHESFRLTLYEWKLFGTPIAQDITPLLASLTAANMLLSPLGKLVVPLTWKPLIAVLTFFLHAPSGGLKFNKNFVQFVINF